MSLEEHDLERFVTAQSPVFESVCTELAAGSKRSHWMWFIFPQLRSLGRSGTARYYGLADVDEARAYWQHPVLGKRLLQCTRLVLGVRGKSANQIFGSPDDLKLRSCMTLFQLAAPDEPAFGEVIDQYYDGEPDMLTREAVGRPG